MPKSNNNTVDVLEEKSPDKQDKPQVVRDKKGKWVKGGPSPNPKGRPKGTAVEQFRENPGAATVIEKLFQVANTLNDIKPHKDAIQAAKLIIERIVPSLKASELVVSEQDQPFVLMPSQVEPDKEDS
jgi:hypothetical protein